MKPRQIHQILPTLAYGDAVGNQVLEIRHMLRDWGFESEIFAERWHPRLNRECFHYEEYRRFSHPDNLVLLHYSIGGPANEFAFSLPDRVVIYYHNITPAHYFYRANGELARLSENARAALVPMAGKILAIAASAYNVQELESIGFQVVGIAPYVLRLEEMNAGLATRAASQITERFGKRGTTDWLYVGRLAPNKCVDDIIKTFYYYRDWINPNSRLLLVGTGEGMEPYVADLYRLVTRLGLDGSVIFTGHYGADQGLAVFYKMADLYVSMSEHEGFCIPLIEAMYYRVPVLAYASTGVPATLGNAGVLVNEKNFSVIAEVAFQVLMDENLRRQLVETQHKRFQMFTPEQTRDRTRECLMKLI